MDAYGQSASIHYCNIPNNNLIRKVLLFSLLEGGYSEARNA